MKKYFITGLVILLPLAVTFAVIIFIFNLLTEPFAGALSSLLRHYNLLDNGFLIFSGKQLQLFISKVFVLIFMFFFTVLLGIIARWFFVHYLIRFWDYLFHHIPFVSTLYKACKDVINTIFASKTKSFKQVVLVPFPSAESRSIGLITQDDLKWFGAEKPPLTAVFVPTTPNPTSGFLMMYDPKDIIFVDMKVEEAFKYVISCGVILNSFSIISAEQAQQRLEQES
ncbi:Uncharacterized protein PHSC3_002011 [Chlamydiales bacterium STE3]|nr:Uncharacterized protein PHSC3_002011 [Chlamydiales bacterium STE3]